MLQLLLLILDNTLHIPQRQDTQHSPERQNILHRPGWYLHTNGIQDIQYIQDCPDNLASLVPPGCLELPSVPELQWFLSFPDYQEVLAVLRCLELPGYLAHH